jgi:predicted dehydrogenase
MSTVVVADSMNVESQGSSAKRHLLKHVYLAKVGPDFGLILCLAGSMNRRTFIRYSAAATTLAAWGLNGPQVLGAAPARKVRIGMLGTWHSHATGKMQAVRSQKDLFEVVGVAEIGNQKPAVLPAHKAYAGLRPMTESALLNTPGLDAVMVECERREFVPAALRCARAGKHIHLEKPAGPTLAPFRELVGVCQQKKLVLQMGYMFRYNPGLQFCFRAARQGWLGDIYEIHGVIGKVFSPKARKEDVEFAGGAMFELGCHLIDPVVHIMGQPTRVQSFIQRTSKDNLADNTLAVLEYEKATATIRCSPLDFDGFGRRQFAVYGTGGSVTLLPLEKPRLVMNLARPQEGYKKGRQEVELPPSRGRYDDQLEMFGRMILGEKEPDFSMAHDLAVHETVLRACRMPLEG